MGCWVGRGEDVPAVQVSGTATVKSVAMAKAERREGLHTNRTAGFPVHQYIKKNLTGFRGGVTDQNASLLH